MNVVQCPNGHYYDADRFGNNCPQCADQAITSGDATMALNPSAPAAPSQEYYSYEAPNVSSYDQTVPVSASSGFSGTDATVPVKAQTPPRPAPAPAPAPTPAPAPKGEPVDNEKTVGVKLWNVKKDDEEETTVSKEPPVAPVVGWLVCVKGNNLGRDYRIVAGRNFVGRGDKMDICIKGDTSVSRTSHAVVVYDPKSNVFLAQPGDAKELFYINDALVLSPTQMKPMDRISVGETTLVFVPLCGEGFQWSNEIEK
ncbi:MAG: FHA domain-containing protein [Lachnospiraceae bacterium]|nr:FHA domain-containing protein [Lachnospiraceae bacterium]